MKVKDAWKLSLLPLVSCSSLQWGWKYSDSGSSLSPNAWKGQSGHWHWNSYHWQEEWKTIFCFFLLTCSLILFGWHLFSFSVKPGRIDFYFPCPIFCSHPRCRYIHGNWISKMWEALPSEVSFDCHKLEEELPKIHISCKVISLWPWLLSCISDWQCGFLLNTLLRGRHSDHFASF